MTTNSKLILNSSEVGSPVREEGVTVVENLNPIGSHIIGNVLAMSVTVNNPDIVKYDAACEVRVRNSNRLWIGWRQILSSEIEIERNIVGFAVVIDDKARRNRQQKDLRKLTGKKFVSTALSEPS